MLQPGEWSPERYCLATDQHSNRTVGNQTAETTVSVHCLAHYYLRKASAWMPALVVYKDYWYWRRMTTTTRSGKKHVRKVVTWLTKRCRGDPGNRAIGSVPLLAVIAYQRPYFPEPA